MKIIYHPKGRAGEYADYAVNLYDGCSHGCTYCYAPLVMHKKREEFNQPKPRKDILKYLEEDAAYLSDHREYGNSVFLCFSCDPYQHLDKKLGLTREAIKTLHKYGLSVSILTKGGFTAVRDFDLLTDHDQFGATLTCLSKSAAREWEPNAALPGLRILTLSKAHSYGFKTWVSLEPVLNPETTLEIIRETHTVVDMYKVGKLNYHPLAQTIDWYKFGQQAIALLESLRKRYYIKRDLQDYLKGAE
jgi:DNA repair photolyase